MTDLSSALKPSREQLTAIADLPWGELEKAREQMRSAGTLTPEADTLMSAVEREHVNDLTGRWSDPAIDENVVIQEAEQMFRGGTLPTRFEPLVNAIVREKMKDANSRGTGESALRIAKGFVQNAVPVATEVAKSVGENVYTAMGEVPASLAAVALGKLQGAEGVPSGTKEGAITPESIAAGKALEQEGFETGMRAGARVASGVEAETRESAGFLSRGLPRLYDLATATVKGGGIGNPLFAANAAMAMAGLGEAVQTQELRKRALTDDVALADFVKLRRSEEAKILDAREFKGELAKAIGADLESLKAQGVELKPEDPERARIGGVMLDLTEPPLVPFMMGASITGKAMRKLTASSLKKVGANALSEADERTVARATPSTTVLNRAVKTAKQVADEAADYDTVFRKIRVATGNKLVDLGQRIQNIPLPVGAPLLVGGGVLAGGGDLHTAGVAALTTAAGRYFLGTRYGTRMVGQGTEMVGKALRYTPSPASPWEAVRRGSIDLHREMRLAAAAGIAESSLYALDPSQSPEAKGAILSSGAVMGPAGAASARFKDWAQHGLLFSARLGRPDSLSGAPAKPRVYGTESDAITRSSFDKLSEDSTIFIRSLQDLLGDNGQLHIATTPEEFQKLYAQRTKQQPGVPPRLIRSGQQGVALSGSDTVSGKPEAILNLSNSANEAAGHEVTHTLLNVLEASGPEGAAKVKQLREEAAKSLGGVGSDNFKAVKAGYEAAFGDTVDDAYAINEWLAEHGSVVLAGVPLGKLGAEKGLVEGIYDALFMLAEDLQLRVPGYLQEAGGPITSEALRYTPSVSLLNAMDNVFHAYKLENDALVPSAAPAPTPGTSTAQPGRAAATPDETVVPPVKTAPAFEAGTGVLSPIPAELAVDPQAPLKPEGVTGEADISPAAKEMLQDINDGGRPSQAKLDKIAAEVGLPAGSTLTEVVAALQAKRIRAGAVLPVTPAAPAPAPTPAPETPAPQPQQPGIYTEDQTRRVLAGGEATPEVLAENQRIIDEDLSKPQGERQPHQADYNSAKVDEADKLNPLGLTEPQRLEQRRLADAGEQAGVADGLRALYDKVMVFIRSTNEGKNVYSFNLDKVIRNIDMLGQWFAENPEAGAQILAQVGYNSFSDPKFIKDFQSYLANQSNGYRGDGRPIVRPEGTDATLVPPENPDYTPVPVPEEGAKLINSLMGVRNITDWGAGAPLEKVFAIRLAEANGAPLVEQTGGGVSEKGRQLRPKSEFNTTNKALRDAGFDTGLFHVAIENLRVSRMGTPLRPRPDLANIKAPSTAFIQAGFMPEAAKPEGPRSLVNVGLKVGNRVALTKDDVVKAFKDEGLTLENIEIRESGTEPTVIAAVSAANEPAIRHISEKLGQDAIAVFDPNSDTGYLAGPRPENFGGKFLKEYFLMPEQAQAEQAFMPAPPVESEAFKRWFGDSKVVDADGKPLVVYHGTKADFTVFDRARVGEKHVDVLRELSDAGVDPTAFYFTDDPATANWYAKSSGRKAPRGSAVMPVYLSMENPLVVDFQEEGIEYLAEELENAKQGGYDGLIARNYNDGGVSTHYIAFEPTQIKSAIGNRGTFDPQNPDIRYMPKAKKPLKGSLGKGQMKFFHYSDTPNKGIIDPKHFGKSGVTGAREQAGLPRAFAYAEGSLLGQDAGLIDARKHYYEGVAPKGQIYDGVEDSLDYGAEPNRAKADQMLIDKGFVGLYREGLNGVKQLEFFQPMAVSEANKPETTGPLAEESVPLLPPLALEEIDYQAQDREFARKKAAGEPLYMPKATEAQEKAFKDSKVRNEDGTLKPMFHFTTADFSRFGRGDIGYHFGTAEQAVDRGASTGGVFVLWGDDKPTAREGARTIPVYLNLENPLRLRDVGSWDSPSDVLQAIPARLRVKLPSAVQEAVQAFEEWENNAPTSISRAEEARQRGPQVTKALGAIRDGLKALGYDGVVYRNEFESKGQGEDSYIAFDNDQIMPAFTTDTGTRWMPAQKLKSNTTRPTELPTLEVEAYVRDAVQSAKDDAEAVGDLLSKTAEQRIARDARREAVSRRRMVPALNVGSAPKNRVPLNPDTPEKWADVNSNIKTMLDSTADDADLGLGSESWAKAWSKSGMQTVVPAAPERFAEYVKNPQMFADWVKSADPQLVESALKGLDHVRKMHELARAGKLTPEVVALHHAWGLASRMLAPFDQEAGWIRLIRNPEATGAILDSIDGNFNLTKDQWKKIVHDAMWGPVPDVPQAGKVGKNATANLNAFHAMLTKWNGRWQELTDIFNNKDLTGPQMRDEFFRRGFGGAGIKHKVVSFLTLTLARDDVFIGDRWKIVESMLPELERIAAAEGKTSPFEYDKNNTPEDRVGIYGVYGPLLDDLSVGSAYYALVERGLARVGQHPAVVEAFGRPLSVSDIHWLGWNVIKNEPVGHSSLELTQRMLENEQLRDTLGREGFTSLLANEPVRTQRFNPSTRRFDEFTIENNRAILR